MRLGAFSGPNMNQPGGAMQNPSPFKNKTMLCLLLAFFALVIFDIDFTPSRLLSEATNCDVYFNHMYTRYSDWTYWEGMYGAVTTYYGNGPYVPEVDRDPDNVGYVLTLFTCPTESSDQTSTVDIAPDPGHAFYDAAAVLKYSIVRNSKPEGSKKYTATMYAIVHESAVRCEGPNGQEYDRVKVLQELGYHVSIAGSPFGSSQIKNRHLQESLGRVSFKELVRLSVFDYDWHRIVVMIDFTTLMLRPIDDVYDKFLADENILIEGTYDYPTTLPFIGGNMGLNMHFLMIKPDPTTRFMLLDAFKNATYSEELGWDNGGVQDFDGVLGLTGFLRHFFTRVAPPGSLVTIDRCAYGNDNSNPLISDGTEMVCRDEGSCEDCRSYDMETEVSVVKMLGVCGAPWKCSYDESWDSTTKTGCSAFHRTWFAMRVEFEESCWHNGPKSARTGQFHPDIFRGYCSGPGVTQYNRMIDDAGALEVCHSTNQTVSSVGRLYGENGEYQDLELVLTTGEVTGSVTGCISGTISNSGTGATKGSVVEFKVSVNGVAQAGIDKTNVRKTDQGFKYGTFVITGLDPEHGKANEVVVSVTMDYDGSIETTNDQGTIIATAEITGKLT